MKNILLLSSLLAATAMGADVSYTKLDLGYSFGEAESPFSAGGDDIDVDGFFVAGSYEITSNFFLYGVYQDGQFELDGITGDIDNWTLEAGVGTYAGICESADVYGTIGYKYSVLETDIVGDQQIGNIDINVGVRWSIAGWVEVNPYLEHSIGVDDDEFVGSVNATTVGLNVYLTGIPYVQPFVGVSHELDSSDESFVEDLTLYSAGVRFSF